jgi:hypothetical protein
MLIDKYNNIIYDLVKIMKTCRLEVLDDSYKKKAKKDRSKSLPKFISIIILMIFIFIILYRMVII